MPHHRIDFHMHSVLSPDGSLDEHDFARVFDSGILHTAAVTDHDEIAYAVNLQSIFGDKIIVGEEITTRDGEIIGLYLSERVEPGMSAADTVDAIRAQNGIVYIPHPFEKARKGITAATLDTIVEDVDIIEVVNGRSFSDRARALAVDWAATNQVAVAASSDAHGRLGWGRVYTDINEPPTRETLVELIKLGSLHGDINGYMAYGYPKLNRIRKKWKKQS